MNTNSYKNLIRQIHVNSYRYLTKEKKKTKTTCTPEMQLFELKLIFSEWKLELVPVHSKFFTE